MTEDARQEAVRRIQAEREQAEADRLARPMTRAEARKFTDQIRASADQLWSLLVEAHDRKAWTALGYGSFAAYVEAEFGMSKVHAYRLINQAEVVEAIESAAGVTRGLLEIPERVTRDLKPALPVILAQIREAVAGVDSRAERKKILSGVLTAARSALKVEAPPDRRTGAKQILSEHAAARQDQLRRSEFCFCGESWDPVTRRHRWAPADPTETNYDAHHARTIAKAAALLVAGDPVATTELARAVGFLLVGDQGWDGLTMRDWHDVDPPPPALAALLERNARVAIVTSDEAPGLGLPAVGRFDIEEALESLSAALNGVMPDSADGISAERFVALLADHERGPAVELVAFVGWWCQQVADLLESPSGAVVGGKSSAITAPAGWVVIHHSPGDAVEMASTDFAPVEPADADAEVQISEDGTGSFDAGPIPVEVGSDFLAGKFATFGELKAAVRKAKSAATRMARAEAKRAEEARLARLAAEGLVDALRCDSCDEISPAGDDLLQTLYECGECGTRYTQDASADGDSNRCPDCNRFGARVGDACPACCEGEVEQCEAREVDGDLFDLPLLMAGLEQAVTGACVHAPAAHGQ